MERRNESEVALKLLEAEITDWLKSPVGRRRFLAAIPLLMASCASNQHRFREGNLDSGTVDMSVDDERRMAKEALVEMRKDYPPVQDPVIQNYVNELGVNLVKKNHLEGNPYHFTFTAVNVGYVNAFALPAGTVFVTAPLLAMAETEAELAGVLGHEIGHVKARHTAQRIEAEKKSVGSWLYALGGGIVGGIAGVGVGKLICPPSDDECVKRAALYGAAAGAGGGLLIQKYKFMANSQEDEMEADRIGFRTAVTAGYQPVRVGDFYAKLQKMEAQREQGGNPLLASLADVMSTHPPSEERVQQMQTLALQENKRTSLAQAIVTSSTFDRIRKRAETIAKSHPQKG